MRLCEKGTAATSCELRPNHSLNRKPTAGRAAAVFLFCIRAAGCRFPVSSNYKGIPARQVERIQNESRQRFKRLAVSRIKADRVVFDTR